ncbi:MAG: TlyA family RNA methyltransferase [Spirochaetales bacterium]|nr:TlyA family RNA methyltransferase [Spirochaetales bacterium]
MNKAECFSSILCGNVSVNGEKIYDPKQPVDVTADVRLSTDKVFVSRGGLKLEGALSALNLDVKDKIFIDAGCSTGGFTDCLIKRGARLVYAVDVGYNLLDFQLRRNTNKVRLFERTNILSIRKDDFIRQPDAAVMDLSFRSIRGAAAHVLSIVKSHWILSLVKPQFEWKNPEPHFDGVIKSRAVLESILLELADGLREENVFIKKVIPSPIRGAKGNHEFFFLLSSKAGKDHESIKSMITGIVDNLSL